MPKKVKKGAKGSKGKGKGGKKGKKKSSKKLSDTDQSKANSKVWAARLEVTEKSRQEYREHSRKLAFENEQMLTTLQQSEKDTIDVVTYLKKQDQEKEDVLSRLQKQLKDTKRDARKERQHIIEEFSQRINQLEEALAEKTNEVQLMQSELKLVKEFRRKRGQMQKELDEIKEEMLFTNKEHSETLQRMEHKFFEEKIRLQQEANLKIAELAERAHTEAISNLDETTRSVYKENVRVNEALRYHKKEADELTAIKEKLDDENKSLKGEKELNQMLVQEKVVEIKKAKEQIKELREKGRTLEKSLSHVVQEFDTERSIILHKTAIETESSKVEIAKLLRAIELKDKEMNRIKRLAKNILDQRTDTEKFFLDALEHVKAEIIANRAQYRRDANNAYHQKMMDAYRGNSDYPKIRTFGKSDSSTNNVFSDLETAEKWIGMSKKVDISDLTWEQKERVIRLLFGKMNGAKLRKPEVEYLGPPNSLKNEQPQPTSVNTELKAIEGPPAAESDQTFLTQQGDLNPNSVVPEIVPKSIVKETTVA